MLYRYRIEIKYSLLIVVFLGGLFLLDRSDAFSSLDGIVNDFFDWMTRLGFIGVFIVAVVGNSSLLIQIPYTVPLLTIALSGATLQHMLFLGIVAGIGAGIGEIISYGIADKILAHNADLKESRLYQWVDRTVNKYPRLTPAIIFAWAASVLPDDTVIIPLAVIRYGIKRIALPLFIGKFIHNLIIVVVFYYFTAWAAERVSTDVQTDMALGVLILFILTILYQVEKSRTISAKVPVPENM